MPTVVYREATRDNSDNHHFSTNLGAKETLPHPVITTSHSFADTSLSLFEEENSRLWRHITNISEASRNAGTELAFSQQANAQASVHVEVQPAKLPQCITNIPGEYGMQLQRPRVCSLAPASELSDVNLRIEQKTRFAEQARLLVEADRKYAELLDLLSTSDKALRIQTGIANAQRSEILSLRLEIEELQNRNRRRARTLRRPQSRPLPNAYAVISVPFIVPLIFHRL